MPLTDEHKQALRQKIDERVAELGPVIASLKSASAPVEPDNAIGRLTRMDAIGAKGVTDASLRSAEAELVRLYAALERIDGPEFGECSVCGEDIPFGRLMIMPGATRCVNCASRG